jgi:hypothetical protein
VFTNTSPINVYRGAGRPEGNYVIERLLDQAARQIGISPVEIRRRNLIRPAALPYATATGSVYDSGDFERLMDRCLALSDWNSFESRREESKRRGKIRGRAVSLYIEHAGIFNERMELRFDPTGTLTIPAGRYRQGAIWTRHLCGPQFIARRNRAASRRRRGDRAGACHGRAHARGVGPGHRIPERRVRDPRHRPARVADRCREIVLSQGRAAPRVQSQP